MEELRDEAMARHKGGTDKDRQYHHGKHLVDNQAGGDCQRYDKGIDRLVRRIPY